LREHGRTNNPGGTAAINHDQFAADVANFCDVLGIRRAAFSGESSGSILLLPLLLTRPDLVAAAVLSSGTFGTPGPDGRPTPAFVEFASRHADP